MLFRAFTVGLFCTLCATLVSGVARADDKKPEQKPEEGVVIDFTNWSVHSDTSHVSLKIDYDGAVGEPYCLGGEGNGVSAEDFAFIYYQNLKSAGGKVEYFDKVKIRIIGWEDKKTKVLHPAVKGHVISKKLKPEQLPTVTNPSKKG